MSVKKEELVSFFQLNEIPKVPIDNYYDIIAQMINNKKGNWLAFGVGWNRTFRELNRVRNKFSFSNKLFGFDWWGGLPEDWIPECPKGTFKIHPEEVKKSFYHDNNVVFIDGLFQETLDHFNKDKVGDVSLIHIDCDLYSSTKTILNAWGDLLKKDLMLLFDEFYCPNEEWDWWESEALAFYEFIKEKNIKCRGIARRNIEFGELSEQIAFLIQ